MIKKLTAFITALLITCPVTVFGGVEMPVLMYHGVEKVSTNEFVVSSEQFYKDLTYLEQQGYTPLLPRDVVKIKNGELAAPAKPVMITFDDGYMNNYTEAFPILKAKNMKAAVAVIGILIQDGNGRGRSDYMTWEQLLEMQDSGLIEVGSHTYNLHDLNEELRYAETLFGISPKEEEPTEIYLERVIGDLKKSTGLIEEKLGTKPLYFAYPFGITNSYFSSVLPGYGIKISVTTDAQTATLEGNLQDLPRYTVTPVNTAEVVLSEFVEN